MIHFAFLLQTMLQPEYLGNNTSLRSKIFVEHREADHFTIFFFFFKCKSFDIAYLQLRVELHLI